MEASILKSLCQTINKLVDNHFGKQISFLIATGNSQQGTTTALKHAESQLITIDDEHDLNIFYNQQGIILDINQHYLENASISLSQLFKKLNKCNKSIRISGFLFFLEIPSLLIEKNDLQDNLIKQHAELIDSFINALDYPVRSAIVITKLDQVTGFTDYYGFYHQVELENSLGFSIPAINQNQQFVHKFSQTWSQFIHHLNQKVIHKIHNTRGNKKRILIREFPLQIALLESKFLQLLKKISSQHANIHAIYFTCAEQRGKNFNYLNDKIEKTLSLVSTINANQSVNFKHFFVRGAINDCQELATYSPKKPLWQEKNNFYALSLGGVLSIGLVSANIHSHFLLSDVHKQLVSAFANNQINYNGSLNLLESSLSNLKRLPFLFANTKEINSIKSTLMTAESIIFKKHLQHEYEALLINELQSNNLDKSFYALKVAKILSLRKKEDTAVVVKWFQDNSEHKLTEDNLAILHKLMWQTKWLQNSTSSQNAVTILKAIPLEYLVYKLVDPQLTSEKIAVEAPGFAPEKIYIPKCYTRTGFDQAKKQISMAVDSIKNDLWILDSALPEAIEEKILTYYIANYVKFWQNITKSVRTVHFNSFKEAHQLFKTYYKHNSFTKLTKLIIDNTAPSMVKTDTVFNKEIASQFTSLQFAKNSAANLQKVWKELKNFSTTFLIIDDNGQASFQYLRAYFNQTQYNDILYTIGEQTKHLPEPLASWLTQITDDMWLTLFQSTKVYLNERWKSTVYRDYQLNIANKYPFATNGKDVTITEFEDFFAQNGRILKYFREYVQAFIDTNQAQWEAKVINERQMSIPQNAVDMFMQTNVISNMFFPNNASSAHIGFSLEKMSLDPVVANLQFLIGDQSFTDNQHENEEINTFSWPSENARLSIKTISGDSFKIEEKGTWGLFKLLHQVNIIPDPNDASAVQVLLDINGNTGRYVIRTNAGVNPFIPGVLDNLVLPEKITS